MLSSNLTFQKKTKYAFTLQSEFKKSIELLENEKIIHTSKLRLYSPFIFASLGYFVLTNSRIILIKHYIFKADQLLSIDLNDINHINIKQTKLMNGIFLFRKFLYLEIIYKQKSSLRIFEFSGFYSKYWRPSDQKTKSLAKKIKGQINTLNKTRNEIRLIIDQ